MTAPTLARASIVRGTGIVGYNGQVFYAKDEIGVGPGLETWDLSVDSFGKISRRVQGRAQKVSFTPAGAWTALSTLFPYGSKLPGSSAFGVDTPLSIQTKAGQLITYSAACLTRMPAIIGSAQKTLLGPCEFTCLGADNTDWAADNSFYSIAPSAFSDSTFDPTKIITDQWSIALGSVSGWTNIPTKDGFVIDFDLGFEDVPVDGQGLVDKTFVSARATARFIPVGVSEAQLYALLGLQGAGNVPGRDLNTGSNTLSFTGVNSGRSIVLNGAALVEAPMRFGVKPLRIGEVMFATTRVFASGVPGAVFTVS